MQHVIPLTGNQTTAVDLTCLANVSKQEDLSGNFHSSGEYGDSHASPPMQGKSFQRPDDTFPPNALTFS
jgi:hypothetical protein